MKQSHTLVLTLGKIYPIILVSNNCVSIDYDNKCVYWKHFDKMRIIEKNVFALG